MADPDGSDVLSMLARRYERREIDAVCGLAVRCTDRPESMIHQLLLFRPRPGEDEIPTDRGIAMLRGLAEQLRGLAKDMDQMSDAMETAVATGQPVKLGEPN